MFPKKKKGDGRGQWIENGILKKELSGYVFVRVGATWEAEHRLIVEEKIKRRLTENEVIHHISLQKQDNRISNLMVFENQKAHQSFHLKLQQHGMTNPLRRQIINRWERFKC